MADPLTLTISLISILSSSAFFTTRTKDLLKRAKRSDVELETQLYEIQVACEVLEECHGIIQASQNTKIPPSVERALDICQIRYQELMEIMARVRHLKVQSASAIEKLQKGTKLMMNESERKAAFTAFRNSVLLLRDLCSDIRLQQQLVNMSAGLAELLAEHYDEKTSLGEEAPHPGHVYINGEEEHFIKGKLTHTLSSDLNNRRPRVKDNSPGRMWKELITQNFTRNATIVLDNGVGSPPGQPKFIHVRAKMDTGCNDNLITLDLIDKARIDMSQLVEIAEADQFELTTLDGAKCTPLYKIHLTWYQDGDMKMRGSDFYVVKSGPFDLLIGSHRFAQEFDENGHPGLIVGKRGKKKADRRREKEDHARHLREQQDQELQERNAQRAQIGVQALQSQGLSRGPVPSTSSASSSPIPMHTQIPPSQPPVPTQSLLSTSASARADTSTSGRSTSASPQVASQVTASSSPQSTATGNQPLQTAQNSSTASQHNLRPPGAAILRHSQPSTQARSTSSVLFPRQTDSIPLSNLQPTDSATRPAVQSPPLVAHVPSTASPAPASLPNSQRTSLHNPRLSPGTQSQSPTSSGS